MPARLTAYVPDRAATSCLVRPPQRLVIGRAEDCELRIDHPSVSRRHAELWRDGDHWRVIDLGSKNGTFLAGTRIGSVRLDGSGWLRLGDVMCEFEQLTPDAAALAEQRQAARLANSQLFAQRLEAQTRLPDLLLDTVRATVELAECERGFLLLGEPDALQVAARHGLDAQSLHAREFAGSVGAVQRALAGDGPLVLNDLGDDPALAGRASVIAGGLRALVCLPLRLEGRFLGLLYADSRRAGTAVTEFDLQLITAFADRAAVWIAARRGAAELDRMLDAPPVAWREVLSAQQLAVA
jgi:hypothetical protein